MCNTVFFVPIDLQNAPRSLAKMGRITSSTPHFHFFFLSGDPTPLFCFTQSLTGEKDKKNDQESDEESHAIFPLQTCKQLPAVHHKFVRKLPLHLGLLIIQL
jgi:hypothetical protein